MKESFVTMRISNDLKTKLKKEADAFKWTLSNYLLQAAIEKMSNKKPKHR